ncbi:MAG: copper homeostasis protein CutC [Bacteroidetes bacterium GWC2_33_15]|nr:MAG: copper homeostasis protein CutC [Bacteroidetes bacterium GWA2_33_15]OFX52718.1 MAG: copper homeostasis protein CutC [Bacteroidetes bacterium GWC2_33_15]OFX64064.1 MAG: copper homeostasis protein CutC [Bacteroidetes bacterium GWB2_32_14]OFX67262.1 MAG: copper homeostasis protein CutC [Bacteroidetes bacterium GWD2_33_33]HAN18879.1 copper homeostasis protein CutC [Bacteroidales bacterium]
MNKIILEICANSVESAVMAQRGGANRVELCDNIYEGGTTPSYGTIQQARKMLSIDLNIIIRPRGGDFCYSENEFEIMCNDILIAKELGVNGVVIGILKPDGSVDTERTKHLVNLANPMNTTFHRAFDVCKNPFQSLEDIVQCGCNRLLTSGQANKACQGIELIKQLIIKANERIGIMPGSGIDESNIEKIYIETGAKEFHASLRKSVKSKMDYRKDGINMGGVSSIPEYENLVTDSERVKKMIEIMKNLKNKSI